MRIHLTKRLLMKHVLGTIYEMAPGCKPRNVDKIHQYLINWCDSNITKYSIDLDSENLISYLKDILFNCKEFTQLNISQKKYDEGVKDYNDERNHGFGAVFVGHNSDGTVNSIYTPEEYTDFIDLDALVPNIASSIVCAIQTREDCFLCKFAGKYGNMQPTDCKECETCSINPNYKFNRVPHPKSLLPRNSEEYKNYKE